MKQIFALLLMLCVAFVPLHFAHKSSLQQAAAEDSLAALHPEPPLRRVRLVAAGDLMQHEEQIKAARRADSSFDYTPSFEYVAHYFRDADLSIINFETTLTRLGNYSGYPAFRSPIELAHKLSEMGVDVAALANNHCLDGGGRGVRTTAEVLDSCGVSRMGVYRDTLEYQSSRVLYLKRCDMWFALLNYTYGTNGITTPKGMVVNLLDTLQMKRDFEAIDPERSDCVVVMVHWGNEYEPTPNIHQKRMAAFLKRQGADLILGSHPHILQPYQVEADGSLTIFSLGNLVSNQRTFPRDGGALAVIDIEEVASGQFKYYFKFIPVWVSLPNYAILPPEVGDTISLSPDSRMRYNRFMREAQRVLRIEPY